MSWRKVVRNQLHTAMPSPHGAFIGWPLPFIGKVMATAMGNTNVFSLAKRSNCSQLCPRSRNLKICPWFSGK